MRATRLAALIVVAGVLTASPGVARASWNAAALGAGSSAAVTMPTGGTPSGTTSGSDVTLSWPASTFPNGAPVDGYVVARYDVLTGAPQAVGAGCDGIVAATSCTETAVPPGQWAYTVTPRHAGWTGVEGPPSATVPVGSPHLSISSPSVTGLPAILSGAVDGFRPGEAVGFRLDDPGAGPPLSGSIAPDPIPGDGTASVSVTIPGGTARGSHVVYAVGSLGSVAGAAIDVVDVTPPTISAAAIGKTEGGAVGFIRPGGTYYVYANAADPGDPTSGVAWVTADVGGVTSGQTAVPLAAGTYVAGGVRYDYRSAALAASNPLAPGTKSFSVSAQDVAGNLATPAAGSVTVDGTRPSAADVQTANSSGGTVGRAETGDTITFTFSEAIESGSILAGWNGTATSVTVRLLRTTGNDQLEVWDSADTSQIPLGTVDLGRSDYVSNTRSFTGSPMVMSGTTVTITLGTPSGGVRRAGGSGTMTWTPAPTPYDVAANACLPIPRTETGPADPEF